MNLLQKITVFVAVLAGSFLVVGSSAPAYALFEGARGEACKGANLDSDNNSCAEGAGSVEKTIKTAINIITTIVGIAAVIMIIINGFRFITANGDSAQITAARHGIIYALVGLVIAAFAQVLVRFILGRI